MARAGSVFIGIREERTRGQHLDQGERLAADDRDGEFAPLDQRLDEAAAVEPQHFVAAGDQVDQVVGQADSQARALSVGLDHHRKADRRGLGRQQIDRRLGVEGGIVGRGNSGRPQGRLLAPLLIARLGWPSRAR